MDDIPGIFRNWVTVGQWQPQLPHNPFSPFHLFTATCCDYSLSEAESQEHFQVTSLEGLPVGSDVFLRHHQ